MTDNNTNLPILDDIIKPGNADKAVHQPASKVQSSLWHGDKTNDASTARADAETSAPPATDDRPDSIELFTDDQSTVDIIDQTLVTPVIETDDEFATGEPAMDQACAEKEQTRASATDLPDLDALTEEILGDMMLDIEQMLRDKIRQILSRYFSGETRSD